MSPQESGDEDAGIQVECGMPPAVREVQNLSEVRDTNNKQQQAIEKQGGTSQDSTSQTGSMLLPLDANRCYPEAERHMV